MNNWSEAAEHYQHAVKAGQKECRQCIHRGANPYLQVLDDILPAYETTGEVNLGLIRIPIDKIAGTKTKGRTNAFAANFLPLLPEDSEFGFKWKNLCAAHLSDVGIRDPISCYEFLGRFYVQEGNKRVSVLKYFGAASVMGNVTRIVPEASESAEVMAYDAFLSYYPMTKLYEVYFTKQNSFPRLQAALGYDTDHIWTEEERRHFLSGHSFFAQAFQKLGGTELSITTADAMLEWLKVYPFSCLIQMSSDELLRSVEAMWPEIRDIGKNPTIEIHTQDTALEEGDFRNRRKFSLMPSYLNVAFIHEMNPENSNWIYAHEEGAAELERVMGDQVVVQRYFDVGTGEMAERAMEIAIKHGAEILFTTTASLIAASRRVSARHPEVRIFNCSVNMPYAEIRTYYSRIYEGKFISGAIAGALSQCDDIGYIASYPIYGVIAGINAFALGAQLTRPNARIHLKWSCVEGDAAKELVEQNISIISALDIPSRSCEDGQWGLFRVKGNGENELLASPFWKWGGFYVQITRSLLSREWESSIFGKREDHAVNHWWGISSGVIGFYMRDNLPAGVNMLANMLKEDLRKGTLDPFARKIVSQDGMVRNDGKRSFTPDDLLQMDWLCDNVYGTIPGYEVLSPKGKGIVQTQGIYRDSILPDKGMMF